MVHIEQGRPNRALGEIQITGKVNNNKVERMNGELRDRERV